MHKRIQRLNDFHFDSEKKISFYNIFETFMIITEKIYITFP